MINDQEYITTELKKMLEKMIILSTPHLNNLIAIIIGIITSQSVVLSKISQELKDSYSTGIKWFKRAYYSRRDKYHLKTCFTIYQG